MLELEKFGVVEMSSEAMQEIDGGFIWWLFGVGVLMILHGFLDFP